MLLFCPVWTKNGTYPMHFNYVWRCAKYLIIQTVIKFILSTNDDEIEWWYTHSWSIVVAQLFYTYMHIALSKHTIQDFFKNSLSQVHLFYMMFSCSKGLLAPSLVYIVQMQDGITTQSMWAAMMLQKTYILCLSFCLGFWIACKTYFRFLDMEICNAKINT